MSSGLFRPEDVRDNCGFGLIAHIQGEASHRLLQTAIESLTCMTHRGAINADGKTGDGCGLLLQMPDAFMRTLAQEVFGAELDAFDVRVGICDRRHFGELGCDRVELEQGGAADSVHLAAGWMKSEVLDVLAASELPNISRNSGYRINPVQLVFDEAGPA